MPGARAIRCKNDRGGKICGNIICVRDKDFLSFKRHGREIFNVSVTGAPVYVRCERCGGVTAIEKQGEYKVEN